jgi:acrylyl-CoA reductase (NADPH)/3-hydroxypropionyl-CoA dehydratase/3-hydroxypropionyl-CoA synthetase
LAITGDGVISVDTLLASPPEALTNPVRTRADWEAMRAAALADPGAFHGDIAARNMHWFVAEAGGPSGAGLA